MLRNLPPTLARLVALSACFALAALSVFAQSQATTGNIEGRVLDPNGAVVPGANVTAINTATGLERTVTSDEDGNYRIILLPPGKYTVKSSAANFAVSEVPDVTVNVGASVPLDFALGVAGAPARRRPFGRRPARNFQQSAS
ncbi:MAG: carboxypeptidase-like regulatory domain-containing protein [Acidobacteria bacterium]|nr:carboxypeptidase-like regulatory domain-containing protein [Acidobacteriota bacterium]